MDKENLLETALESARRHHSLASYAIASFADAGPEAGMHFAQGWLRLAEARACCGDGAVAEKENFLDLLPHGAVLPESLDETAWRSDLLAWTREERFSPRLPLHLHLWALEHGIGAVRREARAACGARISTRGRRALVFGLLASALAAASVYAAMNFERGPVPWQATYYGGTKLEGAPLLERREKRLDHNWQTGSPAPRVPADNFSARWTTCLPLDAAAEIYFKIDSDDGAQLTLDGVKIVAWDQHSMSSVTAPIPLAAGSRRIELEYFESEGYAQVSLEAFVAGYSRPLLEPKRLKAPARRADGSWYCP